MTVGMLIQLLKDSANSEDIVYREFHDSKGKMQSGEISEVTIHHFENKEDGYVELW